MTRILSETLGAQEPAFRAALTKLERASGHTSADVRLTADMVQSTKAKVKELGLDPHDTKGEELYAALRQRLLEDDARLVQALQTASRTDDIVMGIAHALRTVSLPRSTFALKAPAARRLLTKFPPKRVMKQLHYRSIASMLKHEQIATLFAAGWLIESDSWRRSLLDSYRQLKATDFEVRDIAILAPSAERWQQLSTDIVMAKKHNVVGLKELGAVVLLPLPADRPPVVAITTLVLSLHAMNEIRAASTYLKLCQVKPDFGRVLQTVVADEPQLSAEVLDRSVPWQIIQRYYARFKSAFRAEVFEPHVQADDLSWHNIERVLQHIEPSLGFWRGTEALSLLDDKHQPVSCNIADVALASCNRLPYANRIVHYVRQAVWHELLLRYLKHDTIEQTIVGQLQSELVNEPALI